MHCSQHKTADMTRSANGSEKFGSNCPCEDKKRATPKPPEALALAQEYVDFLNACKSPWHVVDRVKSMLIAAGFSEVSMETASWNLAPGRKHFVIKGGSTILAFALGGRWTPSSRIAFTAPHSDSPALRIKPDSNRGDLGYIQVGCGLYGGGFWHTWFDRDLGIAGRVYVKTGNTIAERLLRIDRAIANVPSLAIHFDSSMNTNLMINFETQLLPVIGLGDPKEDPDSQHQPMLLELLATELNVQKEQIVEFDLNLYDVSPATIGGVNNDFVFGQFQDDQYCSFVALKAMLDAINQPGFSSAPYAYMYATYNHEEVGNTSDVGASSDWTREVFYRICGRDNYPAVVVKSCAFSSDVGQGVNPNYSDYYEVNSRPDIDGGPLIHYSFSLNMATTSMSAAVAREVGRRAGVSMQVSLPKNSSRMGSTHGPSLSALLGLPMCDLGPPLLAMHTIREISGTMGIWNLKRFLEYYYREYEDIMSNVVESVSATTTVNDVSQNEQASRVGRSGSEQSYDIIKDCFDVCCSHRDNCGNTQVNTVPLTVPYQMVGMHPGYLRNDGIQRVNTPNGTQRDTAFPNHCINDMEVASRHKMGYVPNEARNSGVYSNSNPTRLAKK